MDKIFFTLLFSFFISCSVDEDNVAPEIIRKHIVEVSANEGGQINNNGGEFISGSNFSVTASPNPGYVFSNWSNGSTENPLVFKVTSNHSIIANFTQIKHALDIEIQGEGQVNKEIISTSKNSEEFIEGTSLKLTANPNQYWEFSNWIGDINSNDNPITITIDQSKSITAVFKNSIYQNMLGKWDFDSTSKNTSNNNCILSIIFFENSKFKIYTSTEILIGNIDISGNTLKLIINNEQIGIIKEVEVQNESLSATINIDGYCINTTSKKDNNFNFDKIYIPDQGFEELLIELNIDNDLDNYLDKENVIGVKKLSNKIENNDSLEIFKEIHSIAGIEEFFELTELTLFETKINYINTFNLDKLVKLSISRNPFLTSLNISNLFNLETLESRYNIRLESIDLRNSEKINYLDLDHSVSLSNLELPLNSEITFLRLRDTGLSSIDLEELPDLKKIYLTDFNIEGLNFSQNLSLEHIQITDYSASIQTLNNLLFPWNEIYPYLNEFRNNYKMNLEQVDLSKNEKLKIGAFRLPSIKSIILPNSASIETLNIDNTLIEDLDFKNNYVKNANIQYNINLDCIKIIESKLDLVSRYKDNFFLYGSYEEIPESGFPIWNIDESIRFSAYSCDNFFGLNFNDLKEQYSIGDQFDFGNKEFIVHQITEQLPQEWNNWMIEQYGIDKPVSTFWVKAKNTLNNGDLIIEFFYDYNGEFLMARWSNWQWQLNSNYHFIVEKEYPNSTITNTYPFQDNIESDYESDLDFLYVKAKEYSDDRSNYDNNIFLNDFEYMTENYSIGDNYSIGNKEFYFTSFTTFNDDGWRQWINGQYGITENVSYIRLQSNNTPLSNNELIIELFYNSSDNQFLMVRVSYWHENGNIHSQTFQHFVMNRDYGFSLNHNDGDDTERFNIEKELYESLKTYLIDKN